MSELDDCIHGNQPEELKSLSSNNSLWPVKEKYGSNEHSHVIYTLLYPVT